MMAMTTRSSSKVKPFRKTNAWLFILAFMPFGGFC
jgi:hypothetical protein